MRRGSAKRQVSPTVTSATAMALMMNVNVIMREDGLRRFRM